MKIINSISNKIFDGNTCSEYLKSISGNTNDLFISKSGIPWLRYEKNSFVRFPVYNLTPPDKREILEVLKMEKCYLISFNKEKTQNDYNSFIYVCRNKNYSIQDLPSSMKRNIKKAEKEFKFREINKEDFLLKGYRCFRDTRVRNNLNDYKKKDFLNAFSKWCIYNCNRIFGLLRDNEIVAFVTASEINTWVEVGLYSMNDFLQLRPNDFLIYSVINYYLRQEGFDFVSFGLSSVQKQYHLDGLHKFKIKSGFEAIPIKREFILKKSLNFLKLPLTQILIRILLKFLPNSRRLKKIMGILMRFT